MKPTAAGWFWLGYAAVLSGALVCCTRAHAAQIEVGAGIAQAQTNGDGTWYQLGNPHALQLRSRALLLGLTGDVSAHVAWHLDAVDLGTVGVDSWDTVADANYSLAQQRCLATCDRLAHLVGSGHVYGVAATLEAHTRGAWQIGVEAGPFIYHSRFGIASANYTAVTGWTSPYSGGCNPDYWSAAPGGIARTCSGWHVGAVAGVRVAHGRWALSVRRYWDGAGCPMAATNDPWPPLWHAQTVAMLTYRF